MYLRGKKPPLKNDLFHKIHQSARFWKLTILLSGKFLQNFRQLKPISNISRKNWFLRLSKCKNNIDALPQKGILIFTLVLFWDNGRFPPPLYQNCSWFGGKFQIDQSECLRGGRMMLCRLCTSDTWENGQNNNSFGQISKIFESSNYFQLHNFKSKWFH